MPGRVVARNPDGSPRLTVWAKSDPDPENPLLALIEAGRMSPGASRPSPSLVSTVTPRPAPPPDGAEAPPPMPGLLRRAATFAGAVVRHVAAGMPEARADIKAARLAICGACPLNEAGTCRSCGCLVAVKAGWAGEACPEGQWGAVATQGPPASADAAGAALAERVELLVASCDYRTGPTCGHGCGARWHCWQGRGPDPARPDVVSKADCYRCVTERAPG